MFVTSDECSLRLADQQDRKAAVRPSTEAAEDERPALRDMKVKGMDDSTYACVDADFFTGHVHQRSLG
eukprot:SAG31_NODE_409_length_16006_cov_10.345760_5_plen_68_part_00